VVSFSSHGNEAGLNCLLGLLSGSATSSLIVWGTRGHDISSGAYWLIGVVCGEMCTSQNAWEIGGISDHVA